VASQDNPFGPTLSLAPLPRASLRFGRECARMAGCRQRMAGHVATEALPAPERSLRPSPQGTVSTVRLGREHKRLARRLALAAGGVTAGTPSGPGRDPVVASKPSASVVASVRCTSKPASAAVERLLLGLNGRSLTMGGLRSVEHCVKLRAHALGGARRAPPAGARQLERIVRRRPIGCASSVVPRMALRSLRPAHIWLRGLRPTRRPLLTRAPRRVAQQDYASAIGWLAESLRTRA
jgi:hypothetical protein